MWVDRESRKAEWCCFQSDWLVCLLVAVGLCFLAIRQGRLPRSTRRADRRPGRFGHRGLCGDAQWRIEAAKALLRVPAPVAMEQVTGASTTTACR